MRKLLTILFSFFTIVSLAQNSSVPTPPLPNWNYVGSPTYLTDTRGVHRVAYGFIHARYADTATANTNAYIKSYPGLVIVVGDTVYMRNSTATQWLVTNGSGGGGGSGTVTNVATGFGLLGGPVTTTGTIEADTTLLGTKQWVYNVLDSLPTITATEGLTAVSNNIMLGGPLGSASPLLTNRQIDLNGKILYFTKGVPSPDITAFDDRYTPFNIHIIDSVTSDAPDFPVVAKSGGNFHRTIRYYPPGYKVFNRYGWRMALETQVGDSVIEPSVGGDYYAALIAEHQISPLEGHTGRSVVRSGHGGFSFNFAHEGIPTLLANVFFDGTDATKYIYYKGFLTGIRPYLVMANGATDTVENMVYYSASSFVNTPSWVKRSFVLRPDATHNRSQQPFFLYDTARRERSFHAGNLALGPGVDSSDYKLDVRGTGRFSDSLTLLTATNTADTTGYDVVLRRRTGGTLTRVSASELLAFGGGGGGGSSLFPTTGTGTATGNVVGDLDGNTLEVQQNGVGFLTIDPTAGNEMSRLRSTNEVTGNYAQVELLTAEEGVQFTISGDFDGVNNIQIQGTAVSGSETLTYLADTHTFTGAVIFSALAGNGSGLIAVDNAGNISFTSSGAGFANPMTTLNDIIVGGASGTPIRLGAGSNGQFLRINASGTALEWATLSGGGDALTANPLSQFASTTSSQFAGVISNETGTGVVVFATAPSMSSITLAAGTASAGTAPLYFTAGIELTTPVSGAMNFDGNRFLTTTASGRGVSPSVMFARSTSTHSLADNTTDQDAFASSQNTWTLQGNTTYKFKMRLDIEMGTTTHLTQIGYTIGGGGSLTSIIYTVTSFNPAAPTAQYTNIYKVATASTVSLFNNQSGIVIMVEGEIRVNAGGTITPFVKFSAAPGGTNQVMAGSFIEFIPIGDGSVNNVGNVQ